MKDSPAPQCLSRRSLISWEMTLGAPVWPTSCWFLSRYLLSRETWQGGWVNMPVRWETQRRQLNETDQMTVTCFTRRSPKRCRKWACRKNGIWETIQGVHSSPADYGQKENKRPVIPNLCWGQHVTHTFSESSNRWIQGTEVWVPSAHAESEVVTEHIGCWGQWRWTRKAISNFSMERWFVSGQLLQEDIGIRHVEELEGSGGWKAVSMVTETFCCSSMNLQQFTTMGQTVTSEGDHDRIEATSPCYIRVSFIIPKHNSDLRRKMETISYMEWKHANSSSEVNLPSSETKPVLQRYYGD